jgi:curved DNA-binding protein CbpA
MINYYNLLEVSNTATNHQIKIAYRKLAQKHHPDRCQTTEAEEMMKLLNEAKDILLNAHHRTEYDEQLKSFNNFKKRQQKEEQTRAEKEAHAKREEQARAEKEAHAKREEQARAKINERQKLKVFFLALFIIGVTFFYLNIQSKPTEVETIEPTEVETIEPTEVETIEPTEVETIEPTEVETIEPTEVENIRDNHLALSEKIDSKKDKIQNNSSNKIQYNQKHMDSKSHDIEKNTNSISNKSREINDVKKPIKPEQQSLDLDNESFM